MCSRMSRFRSKRYLKRLFDPVDPVPPQTFAEEALQIAAAHIAPLQPAPKRTMIALE